MRKTLVGAIFSALAIGVASTTFAAVNPFSDVPADHWSFDAVTNLAREGVIEGYGDGTFSGDAHITRYEMAQMVAKAMAKSGSLGESDQALIDRLAAEYADELNNLGVRVAELEQKSDNVKIQGLLRMEGARLDPDEHATDDSAKGLLRLDITGKVNDDWAVKGRLDGSVDFEEGGTNSGLSVKRAYANGPLFGGADTKIGKFAQSDSKLSTSNMIIDANVSGIEFVFGNKLKTELTYGRISKGDYSYTKDMKGGLGAGQKLGDHNEYARVQLGYDVSDNLALAAGWYHIKSKDGNLFYDGAGMNDSNDIWMVGFDYKFNPDWKLGAMYAASSLDAPKTGPKRFANSDNEETYGVLLSYKGTKKSVAGSYGLWAGYRQDGQFATITSTSWKGVYGAKGYEIGADYMFDKNILGKLVYFDGEYLTANKEDVNRIFGRVEFYF